MIENLTLEQAKTIGYQCYINGNEIVFTHGEDAVTHPWPTNISVSLLGYRVTKAMGHCNPDRRRPREDYNFV
jgi:hypothetical protein